MSGTAAVTKKHRAPEIHFYEWRMTSWSMSEARERLDATGRGAYRELLDICYAQGGFPNDPSYIQSVTRSTPEQYEKFWPIVKKYFPVGKNNVAHNKSADAYRRNYFTFVHAQRTRGKTGGKTRARKSNGVNGISSDGLATASKKPSQDNTLLDNTIQDNTIHTTTTQPKQALGESVLPEVPKNPDPYHRWRDDEQYLELQRAYLDANAMPAGIVLTDDDFAEAYRFWEHLDFQQKLDAIAGVRQRDQNGTDPAYYQKPINYLKFPLKFLASRPRMADSRRSSSVEEAFKSA